MQWVYIHFHIEFRRYTPFGATLLMHSTYVGTDSEISPKAIFSKPKVPMRDEKKGIRELVYIVYNI